MLSQSHFFQNMIVFLIMNNREMNCQFPVLRIMHKVLYQYIFFYLLY